MLNNANLKNIAPKDFRQKVRQGEWGEPTANVCFGYAQANLVIVPKDMAFEFFLFCLRNWMACPVIDATQAGSPHPSLVAPEADLRTDLPVYRVFRNGKLADEPTDITGYWRDDLVCFLLGCINTIDWAFRVAGIKFRRLGAFTSNIECVQAGRFSGPMAVSLRLFKGTESLIRAIQISSRFPNAHGVPVHIGDPAAIGISDICHSDFVPHANAAPQQPDETAVFWGCGITVELAALRAKLPLMITHKAGHMFVTDLLAGEFAIL